MRFLQVHTNSHGLLAENGRPKGGLEKVVIDTHDALKKCGFESFIFDSDQSFFQDSMKFDLSRNGYTKSKELMLAGIENLQPDYIIVHGSNKFYSYLTKNGIPCIFVDHQNHTSINKMYHEELFGWTIPESRKIGSKYITVSQIAAESKEERVNAQKLFPGTFVHDSWIKFQYATDELINTPVAKSNGKFLTIGRCAADKAPHKVIDIAKKYGKPYTIVSMISEGNEKEQEYYNKYFKDEDNLLLNFPRKKTLELLSESSMYVSTCSIESAGISGFEALSCGIPLYLIDSKKYQHASRMFAETDEHIYCDKDSDEKFRILFNLSYDERVNLKEQTLKFNSMEKFIESLLMICKSSTKFQAERKLDSSLEFFF